MATIQEIRNENQAFLESMKERRGRFFQMIRTMSRFHRYPVQAQLSIAQHAPSYASAYATEDIWNRLGRTVPEGATGIEIDTGSEEPSVIYEVGNTVGPRQNLIWRFDKRDTAIFDGLAPENGSVPAKVAELCRSGMEDGRDASIAAAIILSRLGYDYRNAVDINSIQLESLETDALAVSLANANGFARGILDDIAEYVRKGKDADHARETNSRLRTLVRAQAEVPERGEPGNAPGDGREGDAGRVPDGRGGEVQPEVPGDSGRNPGEMGSSGVREDGNEPDGMAGTDERSEDGSQRDHDAGGVQPVDPPAPEVSFEEMRDVALQKVDFLNSDITRHRIREFYAMAMNENSPFQEEAQKELRLAYAASEEEIREAHGRFLDALRDHVLANAAVLDSSHTNERISTIFERSKDESNTDDIALTEDLLIYTTDELRDFSNKYLDFLISEGLAEGEDIERRKQEQREADRQDGLTMDSTVREFYRLRHPDDGIANRIPENLTFHEILQQMRSGRDLYSIIDVSDSFMRQQVFRQMESMDDSLSYSDLYDMDSANYLNAQDAAEAEMGSARNSEEENPQQGVEDAFTEGLPPQDGSVGNMEDEGELGDVPEDESGLSDAFTDGLPAQEESANGTENESGSEDVRENAQAETSQPTPENASEPDTLPAIDREESPAASYKYYLDRRPADLGSVPSNFASLNRNDPEGRYGAIYYSRPLTREEIRDYELTPELDRVASAWFDSWQDPDFDNMEIRDTEIREYRRITGMLKNLYMNTSRTDGSFSTLVENVLQRAGISNQEAMSALTRYAYGVQDLYARKIDYIHIVDEYEATGTARPFDASKPVLADAPAPSADPEAQTVPEAESASSEPAAETQAAETASQDRSEEIRSALDANAYDNSKKAFQRNLLAIRVMKEIEASGRTPTEDETALMRSYSGFGGLREQVFRDGFQGWEAEQQELKDALTETEYEALRSSTLTAFYTPPELVEAIYKSLDSIGFKKGNILDKRTAYLIQANEREKSSQSLETRACEDLQDYGAVA